MINTRASEMISLIANHQIVNDFEKKLPTKHTLENISF